MNSDAMNYPSYHLVYLDTNPPSVKVVQEGYEDKRYTYPELELIVKGLIGKAEEYDRWVALYAAMKLLVGHSG